jgi:hypothetical protein
VLARITGNDDIGWTVDHSVRRFIRPVLMRDPVAYAEQQQKKAAKDYTPLEQARVAERAAKDAAAKSQKLAKDVTKSAANAEKASTEAQAAAAASEISRAQAIATTKAVAEADKAKETQQQAGGKAG